MTSKTFVQEVRELEEGETKQFVTMKVANQLFGIPVEKVQDVLSRQALTPVPLAPNEVVGALNLRGRIVVAIDVRTRLGLEKLPKREKSMNIVVEHEEEFYSLIVDSVGEVLNLPLSSFSNTPENLSARWQEVSSGVFTLKDELLVSLNVNSLLNFVPASI